MKDTCSLVSNNRYYYPVFVWVNMHREVKQIMWGCSQNYESQNLKAGSRDLIQSQALKHQVLLPLKSEWNQRKALIKKRSGASFVWKLCFQTNKGNSALRQSFTGQLREMDPDFANTVRVEHHKPVLSLGPCVTGTRGLGSPVEKGDEVPITESSSIKNGSGSFEGSRWMESSYR